MAKFKATRRAFIKGAGATLALPILPALNAQAQAGVYPKRLVMFYVPEGIEPKYWWPTQTGTGFQLHDSLAPLVNYHNDLTIIKGINAESTKSTQDCYHNYAMPHIFSGGPGGNSISYNGVTTPGGITIDRFIGKHLRGPAAFQSYEMGVQVGGSEIQRVMTYDGVGMKRESVSNPYKVFTDLSGQAGTASNANLAQYYKQKKSVLDSVLGELNALRCKVGSEGKTKLDAHTDSVRAVEQQLQTLAASGGNFKNLISVDASWNNSGKYGLAANFPAVGQLQMDMIVAALQTDLTRVASIQWSNTVSRVGFPWISDLFYKGFDHHDKISHNTSPEAIEDRRRIYTWYAQQFLYFIDKLKQIPEPSNTSTTLLDNTLVVYISEMSIGNEHNPNNLPVMLAGGLQGKINKGRFVDYSTTGSRSTGDLWTTVAQAFGLNISGFGETKYNKGVLTDILK